MEGLHPGLEARTQRVGVDALRGGGGQQAVHEGVWQARWRLRMPCAQGTHRRIHELRAVDECLL